MVQETFKKLPKTHQWLLTGCLTFLLILTLFPSDPASASRHTEIMDLEVGKRYALELELKADEQVSTLPLEEQQNWQVISVRKGDNLAKIFKRAGLTAQDTYKVSKAGKDAKLLLKMKPGQELAILKDTQGKFSALTYGLSKTDTLHVEVNEDKKYVSRIDSKSVDIRLNYAQGEIENSFWNAGVKANLSDSQIMSLAGIFGWDIDFALGIRQGDSFNVVYEEQYIDGEFVGYGDIVAAEFSNQGESFTAIRHEDGNFYTPEGRSMRKSFLRAPVNFKYISSSFKKRRFHPVQKALESAPWRRLCRQHGHTGNSSG